MKIHKGQKLFLIRGLSGSGKSTLATQISYDFGATHFEVDRYFYKDGGYKWDRTRVQEAHLWCNEQTAEALRSGENVVVANTFTQIWHMESYIGMAMMNPDMRIYIMEPNTSWARDVDTCIKNNAHDIPRELVVEQNKIWEEYVDYGNRQVISITPENNEELLAQGSGRWNKISKHFLS